MTQIKVYVGCALTHAPADFLAEVQKFSAALSQCCEILPFAIADGPNKTPRRVYEWDIGHCVKSCDLMVALCDHPSIGLGYEIATMVECYGKPVLALAHGGSKVTELIRDTGNCNLMLMRYHRLLQDGVDMARLCVGRMQGDRQQSKLFTLDPAKGCLVPATAAAA